MTQQVTLPVPDGMNPQGLKPGGWWHVEGDRVVCDLCPRGCSLKEGKRGFCFVRQNVGNEMVLTTYGRSTGFCVDPIEKKPLNHFFPGTSVLSFGTAGCNLGCKFCQNWDISKSREVERLSAQAMPEQIAVAAKQLGCHSVAFTYNDPVIWAEYAMETAYACHAEGIHTVAVTAGYITPEARGPFFDCVDAANVDLKAFTEEFYHRLTLSHLEPVLQTLKWLKAETDVWFEITNLVIPDANDGPDEQRQLCDWILHNVGDEVPVHFSAFHPDFRMRDKPRTPPETLAAAREIALQAGIKYVYVGNVHDVNGQSTYCPECGRVVIERDWYALGEYSLNGNRCAHCGCEIAGFFAGKPGTWGRKRLPVDMSQFVSTSTERRKEMPDVSQTTESSQSPTDDQKEALVTAAAEILKAATLARKPQLSDPTIGGIADQPVWGVFTTLTRKGHLRSCCGSFGRSGPLAQTLQDAAVRTATNDPRFPPISPSELPHLDLDVWLLHEPEEVEARGEERINAVTVGTHGLQVTRDNSRGLLLPGVPVDNGWDAKEFLDRVCIKAGLSPTAWRDDATKLIRFRGDCVEGVLADVLGMRGDTLPRPLFQEDQMRAYADYCRETITAFVVGTTPSPYFAAVPDADVSGLAVVVANTTGDVQQTLWRLAIRGKSPLQASIFSLCEETAGTLKQRGAKAADCQRLQVGLTVLSDPAMHGSVADADLAGIDRSSRCMLVRERSRTGWVFDRNRLPVDLLEEAGRIAEVAEPEFAAVYSFAAVSTLDRVSGGSVPRPVRGPDVRRPGVAGKFYPGQPADSSAMLDAFLVDKPARERFSAAMVPHAGWKFSGQLAADVLKRIEFPPNAIVICPKHTANGVEWAVAPHLVWGLPNGNLGSNERLAKALAATIDGLEFDAAAHQQEHAIEVVLPIVQRLAPTTRVVGISVGAAGKQKCEEFAEGLADVIRNESEPPLLIVSTDMNHYANDAETRRLDELALAHLEKLDADALFDTCTQNHISMCGLRPAVIVLKALKKLGALSTCERVGYATSADATGDTNRVVGYAGMLFR